MARAKRPPVRTPDQARNQRAAYDKYRASHRQNKEIRQEDLHLFRVDYNWRSGSDGTLEERSEEVEALNDVEAADLIRFIIAEAGDHCSPSNVTPLDAEDE